VRKHFAAFTPHGEIGHECGRRFGVNFHPGVEHIVQSLLAAEAGKKIGASYGCFLRSALGGCAQNGIDRDIRSFAGRQLLCPAQCGIRIHFGKASGQVAGRVSRSERRGIFVDKVRRDFGISVGQAAYDVGGGGVFVRTGGKFARPLERGGAVLPIP
jgi:hypothetical protein